MTEDEMAGWHHGLDGHEFEQAPGVGDGQGSLACCSARGHKEVDTTERLNGIFHCVCVCVFVCIHYIFFHSSFDGHLGTTIILM